jgi:hypothetical protein
MLNMFSDFSWNLGLHQEFLRNFPWIKEFRLFSYCYSHFPVVLEIFGFFVYLIFIMFLRCSYKCFLYLGAKWYFQSTWTFSFLQNLMIFQ